MKIENEKEILMVEFQDLKAGDVFEDIDNHNYWIKIEKINSVHSGFINCICLKQGQYGSLYENSKVKPLPNARLILGE